jgi:sugar lactone lactonase YvrE
MAMSPTVALDLRAQLGECPIWSEEEQALFFVDIKGRALHRYAPGTGEHSRIPMPEDIGCIGFRAGGGFIAGFRSGLWLLDGQGRRERKLADNPEDQATSRFNDGRVDPAGRFLAGTIDEPKAGGRAHLYRYDRRGLAVLARGLLTSNGVAFAPDGRTLYHSDTPTFTIRRYAYDPATGEASGAEVFARLTPTETDRGRPDGAAVDAQGCYWTALFEGGRIRRYAPDGTLLAEYPVPSRCPTMVAFGGPDRKTLFVTSARDGRSESELAALPHSGSLFSMPVDVPGLPEYRFDPTV